VHVFQSVHPPAKLLQLFKAAQSAYMLGGFEAMKEIRETRGKTHYLVEAMAAAYQSKWEIIDWRVCDSSQETSLKTDGKVRGQQRRHGGFRTGMGSLLLTADRLQFNISFPGAPRYLWGTLSWPWSNPCEKQRDWNVMLSVMAARIYQGVDEKTAITRFNYHG